LFRWYLIYMSICLKIYHAWERYLLQRIRIDRQYNLPESIRVIRSRKLKETDYKKTKLLHIILKTVQHESHINSGVN